MERGIQGWLVISKTLMHLILTMPCLHRSENSALTTTITASTWAWGLRGRKALKPSSINPLMSSTSARNGNRPLSRCLFRRNDQMGSISPSLAVFGQRLGESLGQGGVTQLDAERFAQTAVG